MNQNIYSSKPQLLWVYWLDKPRGMLGEHKKSFQITSPHTFEKYYYSGMDWEGLAITNKKIPAQQKYRKRIMHSRPREKGTKKTKELKHSCTAQSEKDILNKTKFPNLPSPLKNKMVHLLPSCTTEPTAILTNCRARVNCEIH